MAVDIAACGFIGIARETTPGTYTAPTKFFPIQSETLRLVPSFTQRRGIRKSADVIGAILGPHQVEGDIEMEAFEEVVPYFLMAGRTATAKSGTTDYTYEIVPSHCAGMGTLGKTLTIVVVRNNTVQAYVGCQVGSFSFSTSDGVLMFRVSIIGLDESSQSAPVPSFPATQVPYGPGTYTIEIPDSTPVSNVETFEFSVDDSLSAAQRLRNTRAPAFLYYGERSTTLTYTRDFEDLTEYTAFKALTPRAITLTASHGSDNSIEIHMPVGYMETYEFNLSGQGDLITANVSMFGAHDGTVGGSYKITVKTQENIS